MSNLSNRELALFWGEVEKRTGYLAGPNGLMAKDYAHNIRRERKRLRDQVAEGDYNFGPLRFMERSFPCGKNIRFAIGNFLDRVVYAILATLVSPLDKDIHPKALAFRLSISMSYIIQLVLQALSKYPYFLILDIRKFFDSIPNMLIETTITRLPIEKSTEKLLMGFHASPRKNWSGLPMGVSFVPNLTNHIMRPFDEHLDRLASFYLRYADDMIFCFDSETERDDKAQVIEDIFQKEGFTLHKPQRGDYRHDTLTFLGLEMGLGTLRPSQKALCKLKQMKMPDQIRGWIAYYLAVGVRPDVITAFLKRAGVTPNKLRTPAGTELMSPKTEHQIEYQSTRSLSEKKIFTEL